MGLCCISALAYADPETPLEPAADSKDRSFENSLQFASEYDDNVFKTFNESEEDGLIKFFLKTQTRAQRGPINYETSFQLGGKKYFSLTEQDTGIGEVDLMATWRIDEQKSLRISNDFKGQAESGDGGSEDIDENYLSDTLNLEFHFPSFWQSTQMLQTKLTYFGFFGDLPIDYFEERFAIDWGRAISGPVQFKLGYAFIMEQFPNSPVPGREDYQHEVATTLSYYGPFFGSLGYTFLNTISNQELFSATGHKINGILSAVLRTRTIAHSEVADITLHLLATLQIHSYPAVFISDAEGQRLLFSDSEDNNFNSLTVKITKRLTEALTAELKYTRHSNELSDHEDDFSRDLFMLGMRSTF